MLSSFFTHFIKGKQPTRRRQILLSGYLDYSIVLKNYVPDEGMILPEIMRCYLETIYQVSQKIVHTGIKCDHCIDLRDLTWT